MHMCKQTFVGFYCYICLFYQIYLFGWSFPLDLQEKWKLANFHPNSFGIPSLSISPEQILAFVWSSDRSVGEMMGIFTPASDLFFCVSEAEEWQEKLDFRAKKEWKEKV